MRWLPRELIVSPYLTLCLNEREYKKVAQHYKLKDVPPWVSEGADATTHIWESEIPLKNRRRVIVETVVCIRDKGRKRAEIYGLLVHEAVHIWQQTIEVINEKNPGTEIEAVGIQGIAQQLIVEYMRRKR